MSFALGLSPDAAWAQQDGLTYSLALSSIYDDNLFRLPDGVAPATSLGEMKRGDWLETVTFGVAFRKSWSLQQIDANYQHSESRYRHYRFLDNGADSYLLAWRWQITPRIKGSLSHQRSEALADFGDYRAYGRNLRSTERSRLDADWRVAGGLLLLGAVEASETVNSQPFVAEQSHRVTSGMLGLRYLFRSGNWVEMRAHRGDGQYLGREPDPLRALDTGFTDRREEISGYWASGKTQVEATLGRLARAHDHYAVRDYAGTVASLKGTWFPTGKLALQASWKSELAAYLQNTSSYYRQETVSVTPTWQFSHKLRVSLALERKDRRYHGSILPYPVAALKENTQGVRIVGEWSPSRNLRLTGHAGRETREASTAIYAYEASQIGVSLQAGF